MISGHRILHTAIFAFGLLVGASVAVAQDDEQLPVAPDDAPSVLDQIQSQMPAAPLAQAPRVGPLPGILVLDQERLASQSLYGRRIQQELDAARNELARENNVISTQLEVEEMELTEIRPTIPFEDFRVLADAFDERVESIRASQRTKDRQLLIQADAAQARFFELATPVLLDIVQARGAAVLMDRRAVLLVADGVDITSDALREIDAVIGAGGDEPLIDLDRALTPNQGPTPRPIE